LFQFPLGSGVGVAAGAVVGFGVAVGAVVGFGVAALPPPVELPDELDLLEAVGIAVIFADTDVLGILPGDTVGVAVIAGVDVAVIIGVGVAVGVLGGVTVDVVVSIVSVALAEGPASSASTGCEGLLSTFTVTTMATTAAQPDKINIVCSFFILLSPLTYIYYITFIYIFLYKWLIKQDM
jgi:hypothetical protein